MKIEVGILTAPAIDYAFQGEEPHRITASDAPLSFPQGKPFTLYDVIIGKEFHWNRRMVQSFEGALKFIPDVKGLITAVNTIDIEDYLLSVISSEMKATADKEFLKAHAVISRSWALNRILARRSSKPKECNVSPEGTLIKWFDQEEHDKFDVCADDHCQRYQGRQMAVGQTVREAIEETRGEVLTYGGKICDARFSKCCGGRTELFSSCWEDEDMPYLQAVDDPWCDTHNEEILSKVLNDYDLETRDFHDWAVTYTSEQLSDIVRRRSGINFGTITGLTPLKRGPSGRIILLRIEGTAKTLTIGKELLIRRYLSETHLKSSAFDVTKTPEGFTLKGRGWGHGVGLCQIGAAVMAANGKSYKEILAHYYPGATITKHEDK